MRFQACSRREIELAQASQGTNRAFCKWIGIQAVNSLMRRSSGRRSSLHPPLKPRRRWRRSCWNSRPTLTMPALHKSRKEPRQGRLRWSCIPCGSVTLRWPRAASLPCCARRSRCMAPPSPTLRRDTVSLAPSAALELNGCSWPIGARPAPTCDLSELTSIWPPSMCLSMISAAGSILSGFARAAGYPWSMRHGSRPRYASL